MPLFGVVHLQEDSIGLEIFHTEICFSLQLSCFRIINLNEILKYQFTYTFRLKTCQHSPPKHNPEFHHINITS